MHFLTRRSALVGAIALAPAAVSAQPARAPWRRLKDMESDTGAHIGVAAVDTGSGGAIFWRESERFNLCSTAKLPLVAAVLARADAGKEDLARRISYTSADLLPVSPVTSANVASGLTIVELCEAAIRHSDNTAANFLFASIGGPQALTAWLRGLGDTATRIDRIEPALNVPDGDKDTSTPSAMLGTLKMILLGNTLSPASRARLTGWLEANTTGDAMLRAGLPSGWVVGDKTGRGSAGNAANDIAIVTPPGRKPILIAAFTQKGSDATLSEIGKVAAEAFAPKQIAAG
jgi:beta-lactamase class A